MQLWGVLPDGEKLVRDIATVESGRTNPATGQAEP
jgi:hypothetical protein